MEEIFDHLLIRIVFSLLLLGILYGYRYAHLILYPQGKKQTIKLYNPFENAADTIHYFARIVSIAIVFTSFEVHLFDRFAIGIFHFLFWTSIDIIVFLLSLYLMELIILHAFQYQQEILKKKNYVYACINAAIALCLAFLIQHVIVTGDYSLTRIIILWLFGLVVFGLLAKQYHFISYYHFSKAIFSKDPGVCLSFIAYLVSITFIIFKTFNQEQVSVDKFITSAITDLLLCGIIMPIFYYGLRYIFLARRKMTIALYSENQTSNLTLALGVCEAMLFLSSAMLTSIIVFGANLYSIFNQ